MSFSRSVGLFSAHSIIEMILMEILVVEFLNMIILCSLVLKRLYYLIYNDWFCLICPDNI